MLENGNLALVPTSLPFFGTMSLRPLENVTLVFGEIGHGTGAKIRRILTCVADMV